MSFGIKELLIVLVIVVLLFGTKKLRSMGSDLGSALKGFRKAVSEDDAEKTEDKKLEKDDSEPKPELKKEEKSEQSQSNTKD